MSVSVQFLGSRIDLTMVLGAVLAGVLIVSVPVHAASDFSWSTPMAAVSSETVDETLIVVLITNDVAVAPDAAAPDAVGVQATKKTNAANNLCWCERFFRRSAEKIPAGYLDPSAPIQFQHWAVGLPPIVTGGDSASDTPRAMLFVTDGQYRILSMSVGVPNEAEITRLIEDAEDTRLLLRRYTDDPNEIIHQFADRSRRRLTRVWQMELERQLDALGESEVDTIVDLLSETDRYTSKVKLKLGPIASQLQGIYLKDVGMRFGLTDASDFARLVVLEQHTATRAPWVAAMLPFVVGADLRSLYADLCEIVWDRWVMPIENPDEKAQVETSLAEWVTQRGDEKSFALRMSSPLMSERAQTQLFEVADVARRRGMGWQDLEDAVSAGPVRQVTPGELAEWLSQTHGKFIDLQRPSRVRVLFFRSSQDSPYPIREGSPPGRAITMIRQVQK